jgi:hypothetical protein
MQFVAVAGFEFVRVCNQRLDVADSKVARTGLEHIAEGERAQHCVTTGATTGDRCSARIDEAIFREITRGVFAVFFVNQAPTAFQQITVWTSITGTASVVNIDYRKTAACPILNSQAQCA